MSCSDEEKFGYTVSLLVGKAYCWWTIVKRSTIDNRLTWEYFLKVLKRKFMGKQYMKARKCEFLDLEQGDLFVADYKAEFVRLSTLL